MPELPGPPEHYDDEQRRIWFEAAATVAGLLGQQGQIIETRYGEAADDLADDTNDNDGGDATGADEGPCPKCGADLVESLGGDVCLDCGYEPD